MVAGDVVEMRRAIATGRKTATPEPQIRGRRADRYQFTQFCSSSTLPRSPISTLDGARARQGVAARVLATEDAEVLRPAVRLYHDLTEVLRLCLPGPFDPKSAAPGLVGLLARAADVPDFATLDAFIVETQAKVRRSFVRILGASP